MKSYIFLYYISTHFWSQGNTEAADWKCFIREVGLKTVWKIHNKSPVQRLSFRARG